MGNNFLWASSHGDMPEAATQMRFSLWGAEMRHHKRSNPTFWSLAVSVVWKLIDGVLKKAENIHKVDVHEVASVIRDVGRRANFSCQKTSAELPTEEGSCCDQIKGSSFVWQTPQGRGSVGWNPFRCCFLWFLSVAEAREDIVKMSPPAKKQLKAWPCEGLAAAQADPHQRGQEKWKAAIVRLIYQSLRPVCQNSGCVRS